METIKVNKERESAIEWWMMLSSKPFNSQSNKKFYCNKHFPDRVESTLTGREIEEIYKLEKYNLRD